MNSSLDQLQATTSPGGLAALASNREWLPAPHLLALNDVLMRVAAGELDRVIVSMPPRHGKSELVSRFLPAWYLGRYPNRKVILCAYEATFARTWGRKARDVLEEYGPEVFGVKVSQGSSAADNWEIEGHDGVMITAGVGGAITGKGAHLLIIDDPVKNAETAQSEVQREKAWDWWRSTARTRLQKGAAVILVMTRWHEDDLAGRFLEHAKEDGDQWTQVDFPAICEEPDSLGRQVGDALWPEMFDEAWMEQTRKALGTYWFSALYQQTPRPTEGMLFKSQHFRYFTETEDMYVLYEDEATRPVAKDHCSLFSTVDIADSEKTSADYTVVSTWAVTPQKDLILIGRAREHFEDLAVARLIRQEYETHKPATVRIEKNMYGRKHIATLVREGLPIVPLIADIDKVTRAFTAVARYEQHTVFHPKGVKWLDEWESELKAFPVGAHDDQVDTVSYAARALPDIHAGPVKQTRTDARPLTAGIKGKQF